MIRTPGNKPTLVSELDQMSLFHISVLLDLPLLELSSAQCRLDTLTHGLLGLTAPIPRSSTPSTSSEWTVTHTSRTPRPTPSPMPRAFSTTLTMLLLLLPVASPSGSPRLDGQSADQLRTRVSHLLLTPRPTGMRLDAHPSATSTSTGILSRTPLVALQTHLSALSVQL